MHAKDFHSHSTRNADSKLFVAESAAAKNLFCYEGAELFNSLSTHIQSSNYKEFRAECVVFGNKHT